MKRTCLTYMLLISSICLLAGCIPPLAKKETQIESASISMTGYDSLTIPETWETEETSDETDDLKIKINKTLHNTGVSSKPISLDDVVAGLGIAQKTKGTDLELREFGKLMASSGKTSIFVSILTPKNIELKTAALPSLTKEELGSEWEAIQCDVVRREYFD